MDPQYSSPTEDKKFTWEQYVFDSRVKDVDRDRISVKISGSAVNTKTFNSYEAKLKPKEVEERSNSKLLSMGKL